ncbi:MAG TPA: serine/threonine-protein kinase, partial [Blastocatellia bacterium]|nr:serine/threonine-protein kinase [Blastocatellia bacterium]
MKQCPECNKEFKEQLLFCPFDGHALAHGPERDSLIGNVFDNKYRIEERIGQGGMGRVYRATHIHMDHTVALKVLHPELASDQVAMERFRREARAAAQIHHQNAVAVTDFGVTKDNTIAYLVMEFLDGYDLSQKIERQRHLGFDEAFHITRQICAALQAAHSKGIIHRDLKPDNIWLVEGSDGSDLVKVLDFGIAKLKSTTEMIKLTQQGAIVGTPHYMSPEQCRGEDLDPRSDVYSLGVILYEMLTGEVPFQARTAVGVVIKHATESPRPPRRVRTDMPQQVEDVVLRALEKKREQRQSSALQVAQEFEAALYAAGMRFPQSISSTPPTPIVSASRAPEVSFPPEPPQNPPISYQADSLPNATTPFQEDPHSKTTTPFPGSVMQRPTTPVSGERPTGPVPGQDVPRNSSPGWGEAASQEEVFRTPISFDQLRPADLQPQLNDSNPSWPSTPPVSAPTVQREEEPSEHSFSRFDESLSGRPIISTSRLLVIRQSLPERILD